MPRRFGLGFEPKSLISPSTQHARALFLELLPQLKEEVVSALFETARRPFLEFLSCSRDEILSISNDIGSFTAPTDIDVRIFISSWSALQHRQHSEAICIALQEWASKWNLTDDWCLYHAVSALREQHLGELRGHEAWHEAIVLDLKMGSICVQGVYAEEFRERGLDKFTFKYEGIDFSVEGPLFETPVQFRQKVEQRFEAVGGRNVWGAKTALKYRIDEYLEQVNNVAEELSLIEPPLRYAEDHFEWLIHYQIPPVMKYREIGRGCGRDDKTVREGVQDVATLMGLTLRSSEADKYQGRPKGAKDKKKRFRASPK